VQTSCTLGTENNVLAVVNSGPFGMECDNEMLIFMPSFVLSTMLAVLLMVLSYNICFVAFLFPQFNLK
jgi:hypothetical protein